MMHPTAFAHVRAFALLLIDRFKHVRAQQSAASLAFTTLLSLVPLIAVSVGVVSKFKVFDQIGQALRGFLLDNLLPDKAGAVIAKYTLQFSVQANKLTAVGSVSFLVASVLMLVTIDRAFNQIWQVSRPRPLVSRLLVYWVVLTLGPLLLGGAVAGLGQLISASLGQVDEPAWVQAGALRAAPLFLLTGFLTLLYCVVPNRHVRFIHAFSGGVAAAISLLVMQKLFGVYLSKFGTYTLIYGAFAVVPVFLLWLYVCWVVILVGALIAALLPEYQAGYRISYRFHGRRYYGALLILAELHRAQAQGQSRSLRQLANVSAIGITEAEATLYVMRAQGWVAKTDAQRWMLSCRLEDVTLDTLFERFAFDPAALPAPADDAQAALVRELHALHAQATAALAIPVTSLLARASPGGQSGG